MKKKFKQLREEWIDRIKSRLNRDIDIYLNPSRIELNMMAKDYHGAVAVILHEDDMYAWTHGLHYHVKEYYKMKEFVSLIIGIDKGKMYYISVTDTIKGTKWDKSPYLKDYILDHPRIKRNVTPDVEVHYYNSDVVGDWHED